MLGGEQKRSPLKDEKQPLPESLIKITCQAGVGSDETDRLTPGRVEELGVSLLLLLAYLV